MTHHELTDYLKRREYLINLNEKSASLLGRDEQYDRIRYLRELEGDRMIMLNKTYQSILNKK